MQCKVKTKNKQSKDRIVSRLVGPSRWTLAVALAGWRTPAELGLQPWYIAPWASDLHPDLQA